MKPAIYWRLKADLLEAAVLQEQARALEQRALHLQQLAFARAGLDAGVTYALDDRQLEAIPAPAPR
jgi:hypothetical protein